MKRSPATIGIDIGGTKMLFALFDADFRIVDEIKIKTPLDDGEKRFTTTLLEGAGALARKARKKGRPLLGVGVGCAGEIDRPAGVLKFSLNLPFIKNYPLSGNLAKAIGADVFIDNDIRMGLYGEHRLGAARGFNNVIGVFFGTGIGAAMIIDGKLYTGASGCAGEIGRYLISPMGPLTGWERDGMLDDFVSRNAIAGEAAAMAAKQWAPQLYELAGADVRKIRSSTLAKAIRRGDERVEKMVRARARMAGIAVSNLVDFLNPELLLIGGGLAEAMPALFLKEVGAGVRRNTVAGVRDALKIKLCELKDFAVAAGAAKMALDRLLAGDPSRKGRNSAYPPLS